VKIFRALKATFKRTALQKSGPNFAIKMSLREVPSHICSFVFKTPLYYSAALSKSKFISLISFIF